MDRPHPVSLRSYFFPPWAKPPPFSAKVPSGPAGAGSVNVGPGTFLPGTPFTDSVEYANVNMANAMRSLLTSRACRSTFWYVSQARW